MVGRLNVDKAEICPNSFLVPPVFPTTINRGRLTEPAETRFTHERVGGHPT